MSNKTFGMNPEEVKREGQQIQNNAQEFLNELNKLVKYNDELSQIWKGSSSDAYFSKWNEKRENIKRLQAWLKGFGEATEKSGQLGQQADSDISGMLN